MSHLIPSGSATGNPRNKTALGPGKSLMDWVKLTNSGKDLSGTGGDLLNVTPEELAQHNKETDAWMAIGGIVYNVTEYLSFHPGGEAELMRGVGTDATKLFNTVHSWVNYQSLLKSCIVGRLKTIGNSATLTTASSGVPKPPAKDSISSLNSNLIVTRISKVPSVSNENCQYVSKIDWFQQLAAMILIVYFKRSDNGNRPFQVSVSLDSAKSLTVLVEQEIGVYELEDDVRWPCNIKVNHFRTEIRLMKENSKLWSIFGKKSSTSTHVKEDFCSMEVIVQTKVTHDTKLIGLKYVDKIIHYIHAGHHVRLRNIKNVNKVPDCIHVRSYTPISFLILNSEKASDSSVVYFLIKQYQSGKLSRRLCSLEVGDLLEMSRPVGTFNSKVLDKRSNLILLAAGTGLTPFTSLIIWTLKNTKFNIKLIFFNKTEEDIIWKQELDHLSSEEARFQVTYVLSQPSSTWEGLEGLVSAELMKPILVQPLEESYVCICGPNQFTELCVSIIKDIGFSENDFHCFQG